MKIYAFADEASSLIEEQIVAMKENQIDGLEIRDVSGVNIVDISDARAKEIKKMMSSADLRVWSIGSPIGKIDVVKDNFAVHLEKFRRTLEIANILEAENIRLFSFYIPEGKKPEEFTNEIIDRLGCFVELAKNSGIDLCHENEKDIYGDVPERCMIIHKAFPELKAIFDPANYIQCGVDTLKAWSMLKNYVKYIHIKDALEDGCVVPAGKGIGNLPFIINDFMNNGGNEVTIEPHLTVFDALSNLEKETNKSSVGRIYQYTSKTVAFNAAVNAFRELL